MLLFTILAASSCQDVIELEVPEGRTRLVVDGLLSDAQEIQTVSLKYSTPYFANKPLPPASGAEVRISNDKGESFSLTEEEDGIYRGAVEARVGRSYQLYIKTAEGEEYQSSLQRMEAVGELIDIAHEYQEKNQFSEEEGYWVSIECSDIPDEKNYFRWRFYINDELLDKASDLYFASDRFVEGSSSLFITFYDHLLQEDDMARVEQMSISKEAYEFMSLLNEQVNNSSSQFSTPPAPIRGNLANLNGTNDDALGFFMVSSVVSMEINISDSGE